MGTRPREGVGAGQQGLWLGIRCGVIVEEERSRRLVVKTDRCSREDPKDVVQAVFQSRVRQSWVRGGLPGRGEEGREEGGEERVRRGGGFSLL